MMKNSKIKKDNDDDEQQEENSLTSRGRDEPHLKNCFSRC